MLLQLYAHLYVPQKTFHTTFQDLIKRELLLVVISINQQA